MAGFGGEAMMPPKTYVTISWDDGHPSDLRVAELLAKYGLRGTFYVPRTAPGGTMAAAQVRELSDNFEIGAHTLHHRILTDATEEEASDEITGSKSWVEDTTGATCSMFCAPQGRFTGRHLEMARSAGYLGFRTVELSSLDFPRWQYDVLLLPTTVQAYQHSAFALARNAAKRMAFGNLWQFVVHGTSLEWPKMARSFLHHAVTFGGVFHLWGHSWELEGAGDWRRLEETLRLLKEAAAQAPSITNGQLCVQSLVRTTLDSRAARAAQIRGVEQ
jgi:peptidoglycan-N-acetylglucosamine deacetylase